RLFDTRRHAVGRGHGETALLHRLDQALAEGRIVIDDQQAAVFAHVVPNRSRRHVTTTSPPPAGRLPKCKDAPVRLSRVTAMNTPSPICSPCPSRPSLPRET